MSVGGVGGVMSCIKWKRFKEVSGGSWYFHESNIDSIKFVPKRGVLVFGFGMFMNYKSEAMTIKYCFKIGESETYCEWMDKEMAPDDFD